MSLSSTILVRPFSSSTCLSTNGLLLLGNLVWPLARTWLCQYHMFCWPLLPSHYTVWAMTLKWTNRLGILDGYIRFVCPVYLKFCMLCPISIPLRGIEDCLQLYWIHMMHACNYTPRLASLPYIPPLLFLLDTIHAHMCEELKYFAKLQPWRTCKLFLII